MNHAVPSPPPSPRVQGEGVGRSITRRLFLRGAVVAAAVVGYPRLVRARITNDSIYDFLHADFAPFVDAGDPLGWPMKCRAIAADAYHFWRGTKPLYYRWTIDACRDWYADRSSYVVSHGDFHLGNIGSYLCEPAGDEKRFGRLGFGPVDFDESTELPAALELLNAYVTLRLAAASNDYLTSGEDNSRTAATLIEAYANGRAATTNTRTLLGDESIVRPTFAKEGTPYGRVRDKFCDGDRFRRVVKKGRTVSDVLTPFDVPRPAIAAAIAAAAAESESMRQRLRVVDASSVASAILDVARRTRTGSAGSQGLRKIFVLLRRPLVDYDGDVILYLKQGIPAAAERAGAIAKDSRPAGRRVTENHRRAVSPTPYLDGSAELAGRSYGLSLNEPWSEELDGNAVRSRDALIAAARVMGVVAGRAHRQAGATAELRLTAADLVARGEACLAAVEDNFRAFANDAKTRRDAEIAEALLKNV